MLHRATVPGCCCWQVLALVCVAANRAFYSRTCKRWKAASCLHSVRERKKKKENDLITLNSQNETMHAFAAFWPLLLVNDPRREALQWGQWSSGSQRSRHLHLHLHLPLLCSATHTDGPHTRTHARTDALTDTKGCLPTRPITGLFIRVSYRQYWQPADTQSLQHKQMEQ